MDIYDQILDNLELERELGVRTIEIDRSLLLPLPTEPDPMPANDAASETVPQAAEPLRTEKAEPQATCDLKFISGGGMSADGRDALDKMIAALAKSRPGLSVSVDGAEKAKVAVILGSRGVKAAGLQGNILRGQWVRIGGTPALVAYSPDYIFKYFRSGSPQMEAAKRELWNGVKSAVSRLG